MILWLPESSIFLHGLGHVVGRDELAVLDVHDGAGLRRGDDELRLHAEVCRDLDDVDDLGRRRRLIRVVDVGEDRQLELALHLLEQLEALLEARALVEVERATVVLRERRLEDHRDAEVRRDLLRALRGAHHQRLGLDNAGPGDQEQLIGAAVDVADHDVLSWRWRTRGRTHRVESKSLGDRGILRSASGCRKGSRTCAHDARAAIRSCAPSRLGPRARRAARAARARAASVRSATSSTMLLASSSASRDQPARVRRRADPRPSP